MQHIRAEAVEALRRQRFLEQVNSAYASLRADTRKWKDVEAERRAWDHTLGDGLVVSEARVKYGTGLTRSRAKSRTRSAS